MDINPYVPVKAEILAVTQETGSDLDIKTYLIDLEGGLKLDFKPGQFVQISIPGIGEAPFGFASDPFDNSRLEFTIKRTGMLTESIHSLDIGDSLWVRGPFGNSFPIDKLVGRDIFILGGGIGLAPLRPLIYYVFNENQRKNFGKINLLIAGRGSADLIYKREYEQWSKMSDTEITLTIDKDEQNWEGKVGFPHNIVDDIQFDPSKVTAVLCGPPVMIKAVSQKLRDMGIAPEHIITTLEMRMTCGIGTCGKCNIGHQYVCVDGPVFSIKELENMPEEY